MIAVDTNILVYAHRPEFSLHDPARACLRTVAEGQRRWGIPFHCLVEFLATVTNARKFARASSVGQAAAQIEAWRESPSLVVLGDTDAVLPGLLELAASGRVAGGQIHDARIAALCLAHGVTQLWTADRDYSRFPRLATRNPLVD